MKLEEYISKRKTEDGINEFDIGKRAENIQICVNYVEDYYNSYLNSSESQEKTDIHERKMRKYTSMVECYSDGIREWLIDMYSSYGKYLHRMLPSFIEDPYFLLYDSEAEFSALMHNIYPKIVKRYKFLKGQENMIHRFIKDQYRVCSGSSVGLRFPHITDSIDEWMKKTYREHGVNIYSFCFYYLDDFMKKPEEWPEGHKIKTEFYYENRNSDIINKLSPLFLYNYDFTQKHNLFGIDKLYRDIPEKEFIIGRKQELEIVLMYCFCDQAYGPKQYWEEYAKKLPRDL